MSVRLFCVDGSNLVRTAYGYGGPAHEAQERADSERVASILASLCEELGGEVEIELFFDGGSRSLPGPRPANFRVSFARDVPADDLILDRVRARAYGGGGAARVVTAE